MVPKGVCHLCGQIKGLTYEHEPARSSYNEEPAEMFGLESWLRQTAPEEMTGGVVLEQGAGAYTLCYSCNSEISGNHYVAELKRWTSIGMSVARGISKGAVGNAVELKLPRVYPARILKQIVVMLASVNSAALLEHHRALREYAMNPQAVGLPSRYRFYLLVTHPDTRVARYAGLSVRLATGTWCGTWVTDLVWPPFGYVMTIDEPRPLLPMGDISGFANYPYNERVEELPLDLPILVGEHPYPGEYTDPVANGAFASRQAEAFPTAESVRIPVHVRLADEYDTDGAELSHPLPFERWTSDQIKTIVEALLRTLCVQKGEGFAVSVQWSNGDGVLIRLTSGAARAETAYIPIPFAAVAAFIGHDEVPPKGVSTYEDVLRFSD